MRSNHRSSGLIRAAFTLVELLVVIAIIGVIVGMLIPAVQSVREASRRTACQNNMRQIGLGLLNYESSQGRFPKGIDINGNRYASSWLVSILPHVEQVAVGNQADQDYAEIPIQFTFHDGFRTLIPLYQCPSDPASGRKQISHGQLIVTTTSYLGVSGIDYAARGGILFDDSKVRTADVNDGMSNTIMVGERPPSADFWYGWWYAGLGQSRDGSADMVLGVLELRAPSAPFLGDCEPGPHEFGPGTNDQCDTLHYWSYHRGGGNFLRGDGSTFFLSYGGKAVLPALATIKGGEVIDEQIFN